MITQLNLNYFEKWRDNAIARPAVPLVIDVREPWEFEDSDSSEFIQSQDSDEFESFDMLFASRDPDDFDDELAESDIPF